MRQVTLAIAALAAIALTTPLSTTTAKADSYYGPVKVGSMCWVRQLGNSLGYWKACGSDARTAQASGRRKSR